VAIYVELYGNIYILGWIGLDSIKLDEVDGWIDRLNEIDRILGIELSLIPRNMASCKS
jgi:hypothetical protein